MNHTLLGILNFFLKGWEVSLLVLLPFLQRDIHISLAQIGLLSMILILVQVLTTVFAGNLSQRYGTKEAIILAVITNGLAWVTLLLPVSFWSLCTTYALGGLSSGIFEPLGNSLVASAAEGNSRAKALAKYGAFGDAGRIAMTACAASLIAILSWKLLAVLYVTAAIAIVVISIFFQIGRKTTVQRKVAVSAALLHFFRNKRFILSSLTGLFDSFASSSLYIFIPFLLTLKGIPLNYTGIFIAIFFIGYLSGRLVLGRFSDTYGHAPLLIYSEFCMVVLILVLLFVHSVFTIGIVVYLLGVFTRGTSPIIRAMVADAICNKEDFDKAYSLYSFSSRSSSIVSRPLYGFVGGLFGITSIFYIASVFALIATVPAFFFQRR